ncbi:S-adenosylmethionine decarboxylase related protein [Pseudalkalibacillus sp. SCS-8]|uniref:S-adenosylmethionine decarboxylase related protein n=1 Tax=Pseudalkalibacillus nanhaiensis TaxID=3115291 RepID=UPI0032DAA414
MNNRSGSITVLGSAGGVAQSFLSILNSVLTDKLDPLYPFLITCKLYLIDWKQKDLSYYQKRFPNLKDHIVLREFDLKDTAIFSKHLVESKTYLVVDLSWADTIEMVTCCDDLGIAYVNTALENTWVDENEDIFEGFPLAERMEQFEAKKNSFKNTSAIIGSGMNPGVVQWMAHELMRKSPDQLPDGCYIVEKDTSFYRDQNEAKQNVVYTSWSPECFLDEAILSYPMFMKQGTPLYLYNQPYELQFHVTLGDQSFSGCLMPHEEVYTLGRLYNMETGFIYQVNGHTTQLIRDNLSNPNEIWDFEMKVLDPNDAPLSGEDLVGILLVYEDKERFMYNVMNNEDVFNKFKTNATYFQVACGLYAGACSLLLDKLPKGIFYVDELLVETENQYGNYLKQYMKAFITGENASSEGLILDRIKKWN